MISFLDVDPVWFSLSISFLIAESHPRSDTWALMSQAQSLSLAFTYLSAELIRAGGSGI